MEKIAFTKMVASGNDFVVMENSSKLQALSFKLLAQKICDRKYGVGADGLLLLGKSGQGTLRLRIFNSDGSEAEMCGNGSRCAALYTGKKSIKINTLAGVISAKVKAGMVKVRLPEPNIARMDVPLRINGRNLAVNFINTGVPHAVIFVDGIEKINVSGIGRQIRRHKRFLPRGTNVNFTEVLNSDSISIRTYERGVEDETLACGTGSVAAALIFALKAGVSNKINVSTQSGEVLKVYFRQEKNKFSEIWLEGKAGIVYKGEYYVK